MTTKAALFALLTVWGVGGFTCLPALAQDTPVGESQAERGPAKRSFTNRVWQKADTGELPGVIKIFLSDGTLVQDSCWETHRLSQWKMTSATGLAWSEDGAEIAAEIVSVSAGDLVLNLALGGETVEERYTAATVPFVCPDMPR